MEGGWLPPNFRCITYIFRKSSEREYKLCLVNTTPLQPKVEKKGSQGEKRGYHRSKNGTQCVRPAKLIDFSSSQFLE